MAYTLGNLTLLKPKKLVKEFIETSVEHLLINGDTTKNVKNRRIRYTLQYQYLDVDEVNAILAEYVLDQVRTFTVDESNLTISPVDVLVDIKGRQYPLSGRAYLENLDVILTEVR